VILGPGPALERVILGPGPALERVILGPGPALGGASRTGPVSGRDRGSITTVQV